MGELRGLAELHLPILMVDNIDEDKVETLFIWEGLMDSKTLFFTPNTESVYAMTWLDLNNGPVVMETPPNVLGFIDDHWFHYVTDFGNAGPDKGKGGKYL